MEELARPIERGVIGAAKSVFGRLAKAATTPAIPEAIARGTAEAPALMEGVKNKITFRPTGTGKSVAVPAETPKNILEQPSKTLEDAVQNFKEGVGHFLRRDPNLSKDVQKTLLEAARKTASAKTQADASLRPIYEPLQKDPVNQVMTSHEYLKLTDEIGQSLRDGRQTVGNLSLDDALKRKDELAPLVDPEIQENMKRRVEHVDKMYNDMNARGMITPERYPEDLTHTRKVKAIWRGLGRSTGQEIPFQTHPLEMEADLTQQYIKNIAEQDAFAEWVNDPTINMTSKYQTGDRVANDHIAYTPTPGMFGYGIKSPEQQVANGIFAELTGKKKGFSNIVGPGSFVIPKRLATAISDYHIGQGTPGGVEGVLTNWGRLVARGMTVYNTANTRLNMVSDMLLALQGMPGEQAHPIGMLRMYPKAVRAANEIAAGKSPMIKINGQTVDIRALVESEGIGESTLLHELQNQKISAEMERLYPDTMKKQKGPTSIIFDVMHKDRFQTELAPRLAAALEAYQRSGSVKEFGRVGREITLNYGAGAPKLSKIPQIRFLSPFLQFQGLATARIVDALKTPGSRARTLTGIVAVPTIAMMWNTRNPDFQRVEDALSPFEQDQLHIILPDIHDPTKPMKDIEGNPVVIRTKYFVSEDVMKMAGLGNLPSRLQRVMRGRDTMGDLGKSILTNAAKSAGETATMMPGLVSDVTQGETASGRKMTIPERIMRVLPATRPIAMGIEEGRNHGVGAGLFKGATEMAGVRRANVIRKGSNLGDTDVIMAKQEFKEARKAMLRAAYNNKGEAAVEDAKKRVEQAQEKLKQLYKVKGEENANTKR